MAIPVSRTAIMEISDIQVEVRLVSDSQVKAYHYLDYLVGNPNLGHITGMMETPFVAKLPGRIMAHRLQQAI